MLNNELLKNNDLEKIEKDINDLNEIQQTINELVMLQGKNINNLEDHINNTLVDIDNGLDELNHTVIINDEIMIKKNILTGIGIVGLTIITTPIIGIPLALSISLGSIVTYRVILELNNITNSIKFWNYIKEKYKNNLIFENNKFNIINIDEKIFIDNINTSYNNRKNIDLDVYEELDD